MATSPLAKAMETYPASSEKRDSLKKKDKVPKLEKKKKKRESSSDSASNTSSSDDITININLKRSTLFSKKTGKKVKNINIYTNDNMEPEKEVPIPPEAPPKKNPPPVLTPQVSHLPTPATEKPPSQPIPSPQPEQPKPEPVSHLQDSTATTGQPQPNTSAVTEDIDLVKNLGLGVQVTSSVKSLVIKAKPAKTFETLDAKLYQLSSVLSSKKESEDKKKEATRKLESEDERRFFKIMLTDKGREQKLLDIHEELTKFKDSAIKVYMIEDESKTIVGCVIWAVENKLDSLNREIYSIKKLDFSNPEDEKEITKSLNNCRKAKELEF